MSAPGLIQQRVSVWECLVHFLLVVNRLLALSIDVGGDHQSAIAVLDAMLQDRNNGLEGRGVCGVVYGRGRRGDPWVPVCAAVAGDYGRRSQGGGELVARSLRNGDAGDSGARHLADGHLEQ
ncbi:MAG: hypothetical protein EWM73_02049 [Nitrospira sp.]|nr:MAG: hypothetical protein EWM73_02049 [Nitrospira sp.]